MLTTAIPLVLTNDPAAKYEEITSVLAPGEKYVQQFDYTTIECPTATETRYLEDIYPDIPVLGIDGDVGSWEVAQGGLGACGTFAKIAAYASNSSQYRLEEGIYPQTRSPHGLYFIRIQDPRDPLKMTWMAIDSKVPCKPGGKSAFIWPGESLAPALFMKSMASGRGGCFDEITNHAQLKITMNWFPGELKAIGDFEAFASAIALGGICVFSMVQQFDQAGAKITPHGVVLGHAFAAVDSLQVFDLSKAHQLVRIENPWGNGLDYVSDYSEDAPFWAQHPDIANKLADARCAGGDYWVDWPTLKKLAGRSIFNVWVPNA